MTTPGYPAEPAEAALGLFLRWFGAHYARSVSAGEQQLSGGVLRVRVSVGRQWTLAVTVLDTLSAESTVAWEAARAAVEHRLDAAGLTVALWTPRGAPLPSAEPGLSQLTAAIEEAEPLADGRKQMRRSVRLHLRRHSTTGSVVTVLGGLSAHWAQFTNRVAGSYQLNSSELFRLPASPEERTELAERVVLAAGQPEVDESVVIPAEDCWTVTEAEGRSYVLGSPVGETEAQSSALRRNLRALLREASSAADEPADARVLVVLGAATYAEEEKISWALRGMDPGLYAGYDLLAVAADGVVRPLLQPGRSTMPWDAPLPGQ
ncbi:MAG: hypothetical protein ACKVT1_14685 [Dehalococcoidia bacterium]